MMYEKDIARRFKFLAASDGSLFIAAKQTDFKDFYFPTGIDVQADLSPHQVMLPIEGDLIACSSKQNPVVLSENEKIPNIQLNTISDWTLPGKETLFLELDGLTENDTFTLRFRVEKIEYTNTSLEYSMFLAAHRVNADVTVSYISEHGRILRSEIHIVSNDYVGGQDTSKHKRVVVKYADVAPIAAIDVTFRINEITQLDPPSPPYIFLSDPSLRSAQSRTGPKPITVKGNGKNEQINRVILDPYTEKTHEIIIGNVPIRLYKRPNTQVLLGQCSGRTIQATAEPAGVYSVYFDGSYACEAHLGPANGNIVVPEKFLDGQAHHVAVRDIHGLYTLREDFIFIPKTLTPYDVLQRETVPGEQFQLAGQAANRYKSFVAKSKTVRSLEELRQINHAHYILTKGVDGLSRDDFKKIFFEKSECPVASIIIPAHNNFAYTYSCLCALYLAPSDVETEVILVDDGSTDETKYLHNYASGITILRNEDAERFIGACNKGAEIAQGQYLVFLNNDTEPTAGWLDELIAPFTRFKNVGATGSKLLYPNGSLQDAGGIVWADGTPWNYGHGENPNEPRFCYTRDADYLSGAALMVSAEVWTKVGGFSSYLKPMYFEDTDLAFKIREAGYRTLFAPLSTVYHHEGKTSGTDISSGLKKHQADNLPKFAHRWRRTLSTHGVEGVDVDTEKDRRVSGRVAFIDYGIPRPDRDAGGYAALEEMKLVQGLGFKATFIPENLAFLGNYSDVLRRQGIETINAPFYLSVNEFIEKRGREFDVFYITRYLVAQNYISVIRRHAPQAKILFMNADLHFLRELRAGLAQQDKTVIAKSVETREAELNVMRSADVTLSYNEVEHHIIQSHTLGDVKVVKAPWVVHPTRNPAPLDERHGISFLGSAHHPPNVEAMKWFANKIVPELAQTLPNFCLHIYGSGMKQQLSSIEAEYIQIHGYVKDLTNVYNRHRIFVAPLQSGAGIKGKVLDALAHGIPCVVSPVAAEGIGLRHRFDCIIANDKDEWVDAVRILTDNKELWNYLSINSLRLIESEFCRNKGEELMKKAFFSAGIDI